MTAAAPTSLPRIVPILFGFTLLYGAWRFNPTHAWVVWIVVLVVMYDALTYNGRAAQLLRDADAGLRDLIAPASSTTLPTPPNAHLGGK